ncbi:response regulator [Maridesulfovibrio sp.]|uniref:response regulator n=1 Tax=Maridesulfovibrio sp. TaxID=2795000 RepID=UPI0039F1407C
MTKKPLRFVLITFALAAAVASLSTYVAWVGDAKSEKDSVQTVLNLLCIKVEGMTINGNVMGAVNMLGIYNDTIKRQARGELPPNAPETVNLLRTIVIKFNASNAFIMNKKGVITAYYTSSDKSGLGKNLSFRPYFKQAILGIPNVYAALGSNSGKRGLYFAAPVYSETGKAYPKDIIGLIAVKLGVHRLDSLLNDLDHPAMLLSPQGVVFASNVPDWMFQVRGPITPEKENRIKSYKQFGKKFENTNLDPLPFGVDTERVYFGGEWRRLSKKEIDWKDPLGEWQLVMLNNHGMNSFFKTAAMYGGGSFLISCLIGVALFFKLADDRNRRLAAHKLSKVNTRLLERTKRYRTIFKNSPIGLIHFDEQGTIVNCNDFFLKLMGTTRKETIGFDGASRYKKEVRFALIEACKGNSNEFEGEYTSPISGKKIPVRMMFNAIFPGSPESEVIATVEDITERFRVEAALHAAIDSAEENARAKSNFLANMSHEIRTPMNAILGLSQLTLDRDLGEIERSYVQKTQKAAESLLSIINDILDFSKIEEGKLVVENIEFRLDDVLKQVADITCLKAEEKGLEILFRVPPNVPTRLKGDPVRIGQIITNYLNNAIKFTNEGEIELAIEVLGSTPTGVHLRFCVTDTGVGLNKQEIKKMFQSFSQADDSTTREFGGTGLGLAICKQLSELMNGTVGVESSPGEGSTFWFTVMLETSEEEEQKLDFFADLKNMLCLVVDDNETSLDILENILTSMSFKVKTANSALEGIEKLRLAEAEGNPFGLVLMDWRMPEIDGIEASRMINSDRSLSHVPNILMVTAFGKEQALEEACEAGIDAIIPKPVNNSFLLDSILGIFSNQKNMHDAGICEDAVKNKEVVNIKGAKVLLVEDNEINQLIAVKALKSFEVCASIANNGAEALELLEHNTYDLVLMDVQMPVMDGFECTRRIRNRGYGKSDLSVVAMTANAMQGDREKCFESGMNDFLPKPVTKEDLLSMLVKWISPVSPDDDVEQLFETDPDPVLATDNATAQCLNRKIGLARVDGCEKTYMTILESFKSANSQVPDEIKTAINNKDFETANRIVHTIKGVSANIGAEILHINAAELESAIKENNDSCPVVLQDNFCRALWDVFSVISRLDKDATLQNTDVKPLENNENLISLFREAVSSLDTDLGRSMDIFEQLSPMIDTQDCVIHMSRLEAHLRRFELEDVRARAFVIMDILGSNN